jgi:hypothetical protein
MHRLLERLHAKVEQDLKTARETLAHPGAKGDCTEAIWIRLFDTYLPERYRSRKAVIADSKGGFSDEIDVVIYDRQYSAFVFNFEGQVVIPAEAVYAIFEAKQELSGPHIRYAQKKASTVRRLFRTSIDVPTIEGIRRGKSPQPILAGFLGFECRWKKPFDQTLARALSADQGDGHLDFGCIAAHATFGCGGSASQEASYDAKAATAFLLDLLARLQQCGTVPAIDYRAYAKWLTPGSEPGSANAKTPIIFQRVTGVT